MMHLESFLNVLNNDNGQISFLLSSSYMNNFKHDDSVSFLTYGGMKLFDSNHIWLNDRIIMCFLR